MLSFAKVSKLAPLAGLAYGFHLINQVSVAQCDESSKIAFSPKEFRSFTIKEVKQLSANTKAIEISLPTSDHEMGMKTASFLLVKGPLGPDGKPALRPYTPTSTNKEKGAFELVVKTYPNGIVSNYIHSLKPGDKIEVKGPMLKFKYEANMKKSIGMVAGGTGITPMLQVIKEILNNPQDHTTVHLIFANNTEEDILLKDQLDELAKNHSNFKVTYILSKPSSAWKGHKGFVTSELLDVALPKPSSDVSIFVCGPPGFMEAVSGNKTPDYKQGPVSGLLKKAGFTEEMVFKF